ncbi:hypothetical protein ElyMa_002907200 [Elysia marginata]|uniref:Uncharacterized protein n=1 Tax=Elysia marginata TaxID=1093978 RepID=A0AAV4I3Q5_9GAST|nr:hypothetical protein ElyMa_002907200 [Elysia marginata]
MQEGLGLNHSHFKKNDPYYQLTHREQVTIFRLRTGHNRLKQHLWDKLKIDTQSNALAALGQKNRTLTLQFCITQGTLRRQIWADPTARNSMVTWGPAAHCYLYPFVGESGESTRRTKIGF